MGLSVYLSIMMIDCIQNFATTGGARDHECDLDNRWAAISILESLGDAKLLKYVVDGSIVSNSCKDGGLVTCGKQRFEVLSGFSSLSNNN